MLSGINSLLDKEGHLLYFEHPERQAASGRGKDVPGPPGDWEPLVLRLVSVCSEGVGGVTHTCSLPSPIEGLAVHHLPSIHANSFF